MTVSPRRGDSWQYLQDAVDECISRGITNLVSGKGVYNLSKPLHLENDDKFFSLSIFGGSAAHITNKPDVVFNCLGDYGIGYQLARSCILQGVQIKGVGQFGIVVDPLAKNFNGSSGIIIRESYIAGFECGVALSPNPQTLNAENIHLYNVGIDCKIAYASSHRQHKQNSVNNLICWHGVEVVFDGVTYGQKCGNMPYINGANIAGSTKKLFQYDYQPFQVAAQQIFAEGLHQIGEISGAVIRDSYFDFDLNVFPDYHIKGNNNKFEDCKFRYYDNQFNKPTVVVGGGNVFSGYSDTKMLTYRERNTYVRHSTHAKILDGDFVGSYEWLDQKEIKGNTFKAEAKVGQWVCTLDNDNGFKPLGRVANVDNGMVTLDCTNGVKDGIYHLFLSNV